MLKRNDLWAAFLIGVHLVLIQRVIVVGQNLLVSNSFRTLGLKNPAVWIKVIVSSLLVGLFFNSLYKAIAIVSVNDERLDKYLHTCLMALSWLISLLFIASIFPNI
jgi:hypothetical protein